MAYFPGCGRSSAYTRAKLDREATGKPAARPRAGPEPRLTDGQVEELGALPPKGARAHGRPNGLWSAHRVAEVIRRHLGVASHVGHVRKPIRRRLGRGSRRPQGRARRRNEAKVAPWRAEALPRIIERAAGREAHLAFLDGSGFQPTPVVRRTYAPRGRTPIVGAWHREGRISAIGALARLRGELRGPMTVLWDRSTIHRRTAVVKGYLARHPEIEAGDLPGYAPEANPDEGVWGRAKYHRLPDYAPEETRELRSCPWSELPALRGRPEMLASFIRHARHAGIPRRL